MSEKITEIKEKNILIATRIPGKGDTWVLVDDPNKIIHKSLTDALEAFYQKTKLHVSYKLDPLDSKLYYIKTEEVEVEPIIEEPKEYGLYGMV